MTNQLSELTISEAKGCLAAAIEADLPLYIHGPPGVGKSDIVRQVAEAGDFRVIDVRAALLDPIDIRGLPEVKKGKSAWATPVIWPTQTLVGDAKVLLFFDELSAAPQSVQNALLQITLDRTVNDEPLGENVRILLAGNRVSDRTASFDLSAALANRLLHMELKADVDEWVSYALEQRYRTEVVAFMRFRPTLLNQPELGEDSPAFPSPRSWSFVNRLLAVSADPSSTQMMSLVSGAVGMSTAIEFTGFVQMFSQLPSIKDIAEKPDTTPVPTEPGALYALATALANKAEVDTSPAFMTYMRRCPVEFCVLFCKDLITRDESLSHDKVFVEFFSTHQGLFQAA